jgi:hypothetical protein
MLTWRARPTLMPRNRATDRIVDDVTGAP